ncbi:SGNH/GDSL hydrolase family protein [Pseudonocardia lacus]|uniref:SGNH/GDSL hydrolase family protein n=1 Tax=Pseudonocardia lacus TaxID=2835865 RepID=UPI0027E23665|nr:SGNH/GDSL hydrolase family protein [Pseudonocardia lacus]
MNKTRSLAVAGLLLLLASCSTPPVAPAGPGAPTEPAATALSTVVLLGDSIAVGEALPLAAAMEAGGVRFRSLAAEGGGNVVGPFAEEQWAQLPGRIAEAAPSLVLYQLSTFDWGTGAEQRAAYDRLLGAVTAAGADLLFVTAPPIRPDDFYAPHMADLARAPDVARAVAAGSSGRAAVLDAAAVWGPDHQRERDGRPDRNADGVHTCPQGAARFTVWLLDELARRYPGFTPAPATAWADTGWAGDDHFAGC